MNKDTSQFNEDFIKKYHEESDGKYFLEVDAQYLEHLHNLHNDLSFLPERMKIGKVKKLLANLRNKTEYVILIKKFKKALNHGLFLKKLHTITKIKIIYWYEYRFKKKKANIFLKKAFLSWWIIQFSEKLLKM